ncbi:hypothetical protein [Halobacteriovorax sp. HLS]|uniref:hypothetical protein n=1 Tax=Halobacteriovorax sp. HLS TaxID=2234000 RepID=UPI000FD96465|nr:hypothetical protein [Halobacteriovorax sp. HLS]
MFKKIFLISMLSSFVVVNATESKVLKVKVGGPIIITESELKECTFGKEEKRSICTSIIRMNKKVYMAYLEKGYPDIEPLTSKDFESCKNIEQRYQYKCKTNVIKSKLDIKKNKFLRQKAKGTKQPTSKASDNPNCPFEDEESCYRYDQLVADCIEQDQAMYICRDLAVNAIDDRFYEKQSQKEQFMAYKQCLDSVGDAVGSIDFCMKKAEDTSAQQDSDCFLHGQDQGYCNGFHYKRSTSTLSDFKRVRTPYAVPTSSSIGEKTSASGFEN